MFKNEQQPVTTYQSSVILDLGFGNSSYTGKMTMTDACQQTAAGEQKKGEGDWREGEEGDMNSKRNCLEINETSQ